MASPGVKIEDLDNDLRVVKRRYRGHLYEITELPYVTFRKVQNDTTPEGKEDPDTDTYNAMLLGKMVRVDGKRVASDELYERGTGLVSQLLRDIGGLLFGEEKIEDEPDEDEDDGAGEATKPTSSATAKSPA